MKKFTLLAPVALSLFACACGQDASVAATPTTPATPRVIATVVIEGNSEITPTPQQKEHVEATTQTVTAAAGKSTDTNSGPTGGAATPLPQATSKRETQATPDVEATAPVAPRILPKLTFSEDSMHIVQTLGDKKSEVGGSGEWISGCYDFAFEEKYLMVLFGQRDGTTAIVDVFADKNLDGLHQKDELVTTLTLEGISLVYAATFLESGEVLLLDEDKQVLRRLSDSNGDGVIDTLVPQVFFELTGDAAKAGFNTIKAATMTRVELRNENTRERLVIVDRNGDGNGERE